ncbi:NucA/NucB deoxyribonuclease domain-containing protein [Fodinicola acaciae]|uniref:WXG100-like domain-containing protein n=1 Tax=Fodinicola acaciae TaxID=2681555 RepID=UPI001C9E1E81|nr:NucA/NucB deoxyribonuclease domain-containing protein [Fodinicola acaciae]
MGIPEPSSPLWAAVKAIHDPWPLDDEAVARNVGTAWKTGGQAVAKGVGDAMRASGNALAGWTDPAGGALAGGMRTYAQTAGQVTQQMSGLAARGENYATVLESAKNAITSTIAANDRAYELLGSLGVLGAAAQAAFVAAIATYLQGMISEKAAALRANPTGAPTPGQPPKDDSYGLDDLLADGLRTWGTFDQWAWRQAGEGYDNLVDGLGETVGGALRGLGNLIGSDDLVREGNDIQADADADGDATAERALEIGAQDSAQINGVAEAIDGDKAPVTVYISRERYPESAAHIDDAQNGTSYRGDKDTAYPKQQPTDLTLDRDGAKQNRADSLRDVPPAPEKDRDEYPPATFKEGGKGASVQYIDPSDNRGAGASMGNQLRRYEDSVDRQTRRVQNGEHVIIETY